MAAAVEGAASAAADADAVCKWGSEAAACNAVSSYYSCPLLSSRHHHSHRLMYWLQWLLLWRGLPVLQLMLMLPASGAVKQQPATLPTTVAISFKFPSQINTFTHTTLYPIWL